jgi:hypothetical protein
MRACATAHARLLLLLLSFAGGVVLWDCRAASRTVADVATAGSVQLLQAMPGGTVLLTAAADGQVGSMVPAWLSLADSALADE